MQTDTEKFGKKFDIAAQIFISKLLCLVEINNKYKLSTSFLAVNKSDSD